MPLAPGICVGLYEIVGSLGADGSGPPTSAAPVTAPSSTGNGIKAKGEIRTQFCHVIDIAPTVLEAAGIPAPTIVNSVRAAGHVRDLGSRATRL